MSSRPVVIIGAGPAGLTAAYELNKLGEKSTVLEADKQAGGISRTVNYRGYRFDIGGHRFFSKVPYINQVWNEILSDDFLVRPRLSRIHYRGHYFDYPLKPLNALAGLGPVESFRVGLSYGKAKLFPSENEASFEQWVSNRFGSRLFEIFFKTYTEKVWGIPCREISADWAAQRIKNLSLKEAIRNALLGTNEKKNGKVITTLIEQFHYPRYGPGMMWEHCESMLAGQGHPTLHGNRVERIRHRNGRVLCVSASGSHGDLLEFPGEHFISSMPLRSLIFALDPPPPDDVLQAAQHLRYRDFLTVVLIVKREFVFPDNWIYIHTPEIKMGRIQNYKNWSPDMVPDSSRTSLGLEYFLWDDDEEWHWPDERLIELGVRECVQIGLVEKNEVEDGTVVRMKKAYPVYDQNYHRSLKTIQQYLHGFENLQTVGRNGLHRYNNQDHSMLTGIYAARNILGEQNDVWSVNTEKEYHENGSAKSSSKGDRLIPTRIEPQEEISESAIDEIVEEVATKIDPLAMGVATGIVCGLGLFIATVLMLIKGGQGVRPNLSLLAHFFWGFEVSWAGALIGAFEGALGGFVLGNLSAWLRNLSMKIKLSRWRHRSEVKENLDLLDKV